jgi:hypothetical protein
MCTTCFNIRGLYFSHRMHLCVSHDSQNKQQPFTNMINQLVFRMETQFAFYDVGNEFLCYYLGVFQS